MITEINNGNQVRTDICDYGTCGNDPKYVFTARATHVLGGSPATAERRPTCPRHLQVMKSTEPGMYEVWTIRGEQLY